MKDLSILQVFIQTNCRLSLNILSLPNGLLVSSIILLWESRYDDDPNALSRVFVSVFDKTNLIQLLGMNRSSFRFHKAQGHFLTKTGFFAFYVEPRIFTERLRLE